METAPFTVPRAVLPAETIRRVASYRTPLQRRDVNEWEPSFVDVLWAARRILAYDGLPRQYCRQTVLLGPGAELPGNPFRQLDADARKQHRYQRSTR